ncbi:MAG TPA: amidase, partial [Acidimicrobiaceae bacterium]|nr:amidase [Acidimicrobiaceae bacterium]
MDDAGLTRLSALEMSALLRAGSLSARELLDAHLRRIDLVNPHVNALVTLVPELAADAAAAADAAHARGESLGVLHGLPVAHKDSALTAGIRTTFGSPLFADWVPDVDSLVVSRQRAAGAVCLGKTNMPEFGAGSNTFNPVFGTTSNPYDTSRTCGGSSGGAAVALATGMAPLCDGSDLGGSLRNPASFCNVVGFRPSPGRVPTADAVDGRLPLATEGPMARTVADAAFYLSVLAGDDRRAQLSAEAPEVFAGGLERDFAGVRVAWSPDAGGLPTDDRVRRALAGVPDVLSGLGCDVVEAWPDLSDARDVFQAGRAWLFARSHGDLAADPAKRRRMKATVVWNIEKGLAMTAAEYADACRRHSALLRRVGAFMEEFEYLACPVSQVPPFDHTVEYPTEIDGVPLETYVDWMRSCSDITTTTHPAISVPAGFTGPADGGPALPVGVQLVGRNRADLAVLQLAHAFEQATLVGLRRPP